MPADGTLIGHFDPRKITILPNPILPIQAVDTNEPKHKHTRTHAHATPNTDTREGEGERKGEGDGEGERTFIFFTSMVETTNTCEAIASIHKLYV